MADYVDTLVNVGITVTEHDRESEAKERLQIPGIATAFVTGEKETDLRIWTRSPGPGERRHRHQATDDLGHDQRRPPATETFANLFANSSLSTLVKK